MKGHSFLRRLGFAGAGLALAWRREQSFRAQVMAGAAALGVLLILRPAPVWWALVGLASAVVLTAELFNATVEQLCDHLHPDIHPAIKAVKDLAAGAVLVAALGALIVGALMLAAL
jgi:diacylglycerol kinase (ATP)